MTIHEPPKNALIYRGNLSSPLREGSLTKVFSDVTDSSQHYQVQVEGHAFRGFSKSYTPQLVADYIAALITNHGLQNEPSIDKVANETHKILLAEHSALTSGDLSVFHQGPMIVTLRKPGRFKTADEIMNSLSRDERSRYTKETRVLTPQDF